MNTGFNGLSFPMRLNSKGGLKMSSTSPIDFSHIEESITQILGTSIGERVMELYFGARLSTHVFDLTDDSSYSLIKHEVVEALTKFEPRIEVETNDVSLKDSLDEITGKNFLRVTISYTVIKYDRNSTVDISLGGSN